MVIPSPRQRVRAAAPETPEARPRARRVSHEDHKLYEPYDGPPPVMVDDPITGRARPGARSIAERVDWLAGYGKEEAEELLLSTLQQFLLARTPTDVICERMQISINSFRWLRKRLKEKQREAVKAKDPFDYLASMLSEIEEAKSVAWRDIAVAKPTEWSRRMRAIEVVLKANNDQARMLQLAGMFDNQPMRQPLVADDSETGSANLLHDMARNFMAGGYQANTHTKKSLSPGDVIIDEDDE